MKDIFSLATYLFQLFKLVIIFKEESQVHKGHIYITVTSILPVLFNSVSASWEGMLVNLKQYNDFTISTKLCIAIL